MALAPKTYRAIERQQASPHRPRTGHRKLYNVRAYRDSFDEYMHAMQPLCVRCEQQGRFAFAKEIHHKRKLEKHPEDLMDPEQCEHLCKECHSKLTAKGL